MKKLFLSIGLLLTTMVFAQKKWAVEAKLGANLISGNTLSDGQIPASAIFNIDPNSSEVIPISFKTKSGFITSILFTYFVSEKIGIKSGFIYDRRGFKVELDLRELNSLQVGRAKGTIKINALTIPFYGQYETGGKVKGFFYAGPYVSIPLDTATSASGQTRYIDNPDTEFGAGLGAGVIVPISKSLDLVTDAGYKIGITKSIDGQARLYDFALTVGLRHRF